MCENDLEEVPHDWFRLKMQLAQYLIAVPVYNKLDDVAFDASTQKHHVTCVMEGMSKDILGFKSQVWAASHDGGIEDLEDNCEHYIFPPSFRRHDAGQGGGRGRFVSLQVDESPNQGGFWTHDWFTRGLVAYLLVPYYIILSCEGKHHDCYFLKVRFNGYCCEDATATAECNIFKTE